MSGPSLSISLKVGYGGNPCGVLIVEELMLTELVGTVGADVVVVDDCFDCGVSPCDILLAASFSAVNTKFSLTQ